ncbi:MAG: DEAD/DEAH box helicase [Selenomonadaceae bacterium]
MSEKFLKLGLSEALAEAVGKMGFTEPMPIQEQAIPQALTGVNIVGQSATGSGKTLAYLLPALAQIKPDSPALQALVLAPTYELAMQISQQLQQVIQNSGLPIRSMALIGGANIARQIDNLKKKPQIVVGSAGRILELQKKGKLKLQQVKVLVLDEFDRLLDDQNQESVAKVQSCLDKQCQYLLFSATASGKALDRAQFLAEPKIIKINERTALQPQLENYYFIVEFRDKIDILRKLTKTLAVKRGLVFVNKVYDVEKTIEKLAHQGITAASLIGSDDKMARKNAVADFAKGKVTLLLATDLAARGLDIPGVDYVFNLDLPENDKVYLHRVGRTGRAGAKGTAISLVDSKEIMKLVTIGKKLSVNFQAKKLLQGKVEDFIVRPQHKSIVRKDIRR